jgi:uncharacterized membrane protein
MTALGGISGVIALAWFVVCWAGFTIYADHLRRDRGLMGATSAARARWMQRMSQRDNRILDSTLLQTQAQSVSFFASTSILILGGLVALVGAREQAAEVVAGVPFAEKTSALGWDIKLGLLAVIFVYAFFKFTWSMRQFNYTALLIGATPPADDPDCVTAARRAARMGDLAVKHFNDGIRAYYFGLAGLTWFIHPWVFVLASSWIVLVLWRREFRSNTLSALRD